MTTRAGSQSRSKEHHVAVGLGFWSAFKNGDIDACVDLMHPNATWYPSPRLDDSDAVRGRDDVRTVFEALHDRFADSIDVLPEDGRQVGDHVLMVTLIQGRNQFTKQAIKSRECWVVSIHDDKWARIVVYPNAPAARLGFEDLLKAAGPSANLSVEAREPPDDPVTLAPEMENSAPTPAEFANADMPAPNGVSAPPSATGASQITLTFTFDEAEAINRWMLKPAQDGGLAADDAAVHPGLMKIRSAVEHTQAIMAVRHELEQAGVPTQHLSDQQVAQLGRRISQAAPRLGGGPQG
jgi:ketosteroid isomerase-like protein